jgi:ketosteroid isomerase-like protein
VTVATVLTLATAACGGGEPVDTLSAESEVIEEVETLIEAQVAAWNSGDLEGFTSVYSEDCKFLSPTGLTQGRQQVLDRYVRRYPDQAAMGTLRFEFIEMVPMTMEVRSLMGLLKKEGIGGMTVAARWYLSYPDREAASGLTLIVFKRLAGGWQIIQDASMSDEE